MHVCKSHILNPLHTHTIHKWGMILPCIPILTIAPKANATSAPYSLQHRMRGCWRSPSELDVPSMFSSCPVMPSPSLFLPLTNGTPTCFRKCRSPTGSSKPAVALPPGWQHFALVHHALKHIFHSAQCTSPASSSHFRIRLWFVLTVLLIEKNQRQFCLRILMAWFEAQYAL